MRDGDQPIERSINVDYETSGWNGEVVKTSYIANLRTWMFVAIHTSVSGSAGGGTRLGVYADPRIALAEAMELSASMTKKHRFLGVPEGGGKAVIALAKNLGDADRKRLLAEYGKFLESLDGCFFTGLDMGLSQPDLSIIGNHTRNVDHSVEGTPVPDFSQLAALGVVTSIEEALSARFGRKDLADIRCVVQGVGKVGSALTRLLVNRSAKVVVADLNEDRLRELCDETGSKPTPSRLAYQTPCTVFCPCASGHVLDETTVKGLRCSIVAGAANDQLANEDIPALLHSRGILYLPDFAINGGGTLGAYLYRRGMTSPEVLTAELQRRIRTSIHGLLASSREQGTTPYAVALAIATR